MTTKELMKQEARTKSAGPLGEFRAFAGAADIFDDLFGKFPAFRFPVPPREWTPRANIQETDKEYILSCALPGIKKEDVGIKVENGVLTISGEHREEKEEKGKNWLRQEISCGSFHRSFLLPVGTHPEEVKAVHKDGVLTVTLPKPAQEKSRGVSVRVE